MKRKMFKSISAILIFTIIMQCITFSSAFSEEGSKVKGIKFDSEKYTLQVGDSIKVKLFEVYEDQSQSTPSSILTGEFSTTDESIDSSTPAGIQTGQPETPETPVNQTDKPTSGAIEDNTLVNADLPEDTTNPANIEIDVPTTGGVGINPSGAPVTPETPLNLTKDPTSGVMEDNTFGNSDLHEDTTNPANKEIDVPTTGGVDINTSEIPQVPNTNSDPNTDETKPSLNTDNENSDKAGIITGGSINTDTKSINSEDAIFESSKPEIAKIEKDGTLTAISEGTTTITAKYNDYIATANVYVGPVNGLKLDSVVYTLILGKTQQIVVTIPSDNGNVSKKLKEGLKYEIQDTSVATVSDDGVIKAVGLGESIILVKCGSLTSTAVVKVIKEIIMPPVLSICETDGIVSLSWTEPMEGVTYKLKRGTVPGLMFEIASGLDVNSYTDTNIQKDMTYFYTVVAYKNGNESEESNMEVRAPAPSAPVLNALRLQNSIKLSWTSTNGSVKFTLLRSNKHGGPYETLLDQTDSNRFTDTNVEQGITYFYIVKPYDNQGREGISSNERIVTPQVDNVSKFNPKGDDDGDQITNEQEVLNGNDIKDVSDLSSINKKLEPSTQSVKEKSSQKNNNNNNKNKAKVQKKKKRNFKSKDGKVSIDVYGDDTLDKAPLKVEDAKDAMFLRGVKGVIGAPVEISAGDVAINSAVITMTYDKKQLGKISEDKLKMYWFDAQNMKMVQLENVKVDKKNMVVTAETPHFSIYVLGADVEPDLKNVDMLITMDQSAGMKSQDSKNFRIALADDFISNITDIYGVGSTTSPTDKFRIGLLEISNYTNIKAKLSNDYSALSSKLGSMQRTLGATNIADSLLAANKQLNDVSNRKMMLLISDGQDTCGNSTAKILNLADKLAAKNIVVNTVALGNNANYDLLKAIADKTDGSFFMLNLGTDATQKEINAAISQINDKLIKQIAFDGVTAPPSGIDINEVAAIAKYPDNYLGKDFDDTSSLYNDDIKANILTGNFMNDETDIKIGYEGLPLSVERTYNSYEGDNKTILGNGWHLNYDSHLDVETWNSQTMIGVVTASELNVRTDAGTEFKILGYITRNTKFNVLGTKKDSKNRDWYQIGLSGGKTGYVASWYVKAAWLSASGISGINVTYGSGTKVMFDLDQSTSGSSIKKYITPFGCSDTLGQISGGYLLTRKDQTEYKYDNNGYLIGISDRYGNTLGIKYNSDKNIQEVSDLLGRKLTFEYTDINGSKLLSSVTENALNRCVQYEYDGNCNLTGVVDLSGKKTKYAYKNIFKTSNVPEQNGAQVFDRSLLEQVIDANGHQELKNEYDPFDRLVKQYDGNDNIKYQMYKDVYKDENSTTGGAIGNTEYARYYIDENGNESKEVYNPITQKLITEIDAKGLKVEHKYWIDVKGDGNYSEITNITDENAEAYYDMVSNGRKATKEEIIDKKGFHTTFEYDKNGNVTKVTDHNGKSIVMAYNSTNDLTRKTDKTGNNSTAYQYVTTNGGIYLDTVTDPYGNVEKYDYFHQGDDSGVSNINIELNGLVKSVTENKKVKDGNIINGFSSTEYTYGDKYNNLTETKDALGNLTKEEHDAAGRLTQQTDARNYTTKYYYDPMDRLLVEEDPLHDKSTIQYDNVGNKRYVTDKKGNTTEYVYDSADQLIQTIDPKGYKIQYKYDAKGNKIVEINQKGGITQYDYDYLDRITQVTDPLNNVTTYDYSTGNQTLICLPGNRQTIIYYDELYRKKQESRWYYGEWIITKYTYDLNNNIDTVTDDTGKVTKNYYDSLNRLTQTIDGYGLPVSNTISYYYNALTEDGVNYSSVTEENALNQTTAKYYDVLGRLVKTTDAKKNSTTCTYDEVGNLKTEKDARQNSPSYEYDKNNCSAVYDYDALNRVTKVTDALGNFIRKGYDSNGNLISQTDKNGNKTQYIYDNLDQMVQIIDPLFHSIKYTYDEMGNKISATDALGNKTTYDYNIVGQLVNDTDPMGHTQYYCYDAAGNKVWVSSRRNEYIGTKYIYDPLGRLERVIDPEGMGTIYTYDTVDNIKSKTVGNSTVTYEYDDLNRVKKATYSGDSTIPANIVNYGYDEIGRLKHTDSSMGITDTYDYDENGRLLTNTEQKGAQVIVTKTTYDEIGDKLTVTANGTVTKYEYDELNRLKSESVDISGLTHATSYGYDANGNQITVTDWRGNTNTNVYDDSNKLIEKIDAYGKMVEKLEYYDNDLQHYSYDGANNRTDFTYDKNNRLLSTKDAENHSSSQEYDEDGNIVSKTDGNKNITYYTYDFDNRLKSVKNLKNEVTSYSYDINGNLLKQKDGRGNITSYEYNCENKVTKRIDNGGVGDPTKTETYTYYPDGSLASKTDKNGTKIVYDYDIHGLVSSEVTASGEKLVSFTYDDNGNQLTMTDKTGVTSRTYDELNRVLKKTVPDIGTITFTYDIIEGLENGLVAESSKDPKNNLTVKVYDKDGRLKTVTTDTNRTTTYNYYDNGNRQSVVYPDGSKEEYTYYADNLIKTLDNYQNVAGQYTKIDGYAYKYDGAHNLILKNDKKGDTSYAYDVLNRLQNVTEPGGKTTAYTYDGAGNRETETIVTSASTTVTTYNCNDCNMLKGTFTQVNGSLSETTDYSYDNNGNQLNAFKTVYNGTGDSQTQDIMDNTYDKLNQLITTNLPNGQTITATYNGEGLRVTRTVNGVLTRYLYEYDQVILEIDSSGNQAARNVYGTNLLTRTVGSDTYYYMYNGHGDVTALLKPDGTVAATYYYDAFGNPDPTGTTGNVSNPFTYAGYFYDKETGLYYLNARMYDPKTARFLQEDSYSGDSNDPLSLNLYTYSHNEPMMYSDPTGHLETIDITSKAANIYSEKEYQDIVNLTKLYNDTNSDLMKDIYRYKAVQIRQKHHSNYIDNFDYSANGSLDGLSIWATLRFEKPFIFSPFGQIERNQYTNNIDAIYPDNYRGRLSSKHDYRGINDYYERALNPQVIVANGQIYDLPKMKALDKYFEKQNRYRRIYNDIGNGMVQITGGVGEVALGVGAYASSAGDGPLGVVGGTYLTVNGVSNITGGVSRIINAGSGKGDTWNFVKGLCYDVSPEYGDQLYFMEQAPEFAYGGYQAVKGIVGLARGVAGIGGVESELNRFMSQGYSQEAAERLIKPYSGEGQHFIQKAVINRAINRVGEDSLLGKGLNWYRDSMFNVVKGKGMSTGEFYEYHSQIHGLPAFGPRTAQGMRLLPGEPWRAINVTPELQPYGKLGYIWYGSPTAFKVIVGGTVAGTGFGIYEINTK